MGWYIVYITHMVDTSFRRGFMLVLSSPSGAGKTTISRKLLALDENLSMSTSVTTRDRRPNEVDGVDYHFVTQKRFDQMVDGDEFLEYAQVFQKSYGTPREKVYGAMEQGKDVLFDIDWQGTEQLAEKAREDLVSIFILPPSMQELENRLRSRGQDSDEVIAHRMSKAADEISHWGSYDYVLVNDDVDKCTQAVRAILTAERHKRTRGTNLKQFVDGLLS